MKKKALHRSFIATLKSWDALFADAADFATAIGEERLISISHSDSQGRGVVTVWYWSQ